MIVMYSLEHSMPGPSTMEQRERVMEVAKTKHGILQRERTILPLGLDMAAQNPCKRCMKDQYFQMSDAALQLYVNISVGLKLLYFMSFMLLSRHLQNAVSFPHTITKGTKNEHFLCTLSPKL